MLQTFAAICEASKAVLLYRSCLEAGKLMSGLGHQEEEKKAYGYAGLMRHAVAPSGSALDRVGAALDCPLASVEASYRTFKRTSKTYGPVRVRPRSAARRHKEVEQPRHRGESKRQARCVCITRKLTEWPFENG